MKDKDNEGEDVTLEVDDRREKRMMDDRYLRMFSIKAEPDPEKY